MLDFYEYSFYLFPTKKIGTNDVRLLGSERLNFFIIC